MIEDTLMRHKRGGIYFEDFVIGRLYEHRLTRTVTQMDNMLFSNMTLNPQPLHIDRHFCAQETEWGQPLMNSLFTLGLMIGISASAVRGRYRALQHDRAGQARVKIAPRHRDCRIRSHLTTTPNRVRQEALPHLPFCPSPF
jgi:acyl dehydratase